MFYDKRIIANFVIFSFSLFALINAELKREVLKTFPILNTIYFGTMERQTFLVKSYSLHVFPKKQVTSDTDEIR